MLAATRPTRRLPEACAVDLAASASATRSTSNRPSSALAAARRNDAVAVPVPTKIDLAASVSCVQGRSGSWVKGQRCRGGKGGNVVGMQGTRLHAVS